jgi:hypothetical protein
MYFIFSKKNIILLFQKEIHKRHYNKIFMHKVSSKINYSLNYKKNKRKYRLLNKFRYKNKKDNYLM